MQSGSGVAWRAGLVAACLSLAASCALAADNAADPADGIDPLLMLLKAWGVPGGTVAALLGVARITLPAILTSWKSTLEIHRGLLADQREDAKSQSQRQIAVNDSQAKLVSAINETVGTARELLREARELHRSIPTPAPQSHEAGHLHQGH